MREVRFSAVNHFKWGMPLFSLNWDAIEKTGSMSNDVGPELLRQISLYSKLVCNSHDHPPRTFSKTVLIWCVWWRWVESNSLHCNEVLPLLPKSFFAI